MGSDPINLPPRAWERGREAVVQDEDRSSEPVDVRSGERSRTLRRERRRVRRQERLANPAGWEVAAPAQFGGVPFRA